MSKVTIPVKEYQNLMEAKLKYQYLKKILEEDIFSAPPIKNIDKVVNAFRETKKYNSNFIKSLEKGLKRSSAFK